MTAHFQLRDKIKKSKCEIKFTLENEVTGEKKELSNNCGKESQFQEIKMKL